MKYASLAVVLSCLACAVGCAGKARTEAQAEQEKRLQTVDRRLNALEQSVGALDSQVARLNNRVYEVRTAGGRKTGYRVVPILPPQPVQPASAAASGPGSGAGVTATTASAAHSSVAAPPSGGTQGDLQGVRINPAAPPRPFPGRMEAPAQSSRAVRPASVAPAAGGDLTARNPAVAPAQGASHAAVPGVLGLPPESLPAAPAGDGSAAASAGKSAPTARQRSAAPQSGSAANPDREASGAGGNASVPVPSLPSRQVSLPPEPAGLGLPPLEGASRAASASRPAGQRGGQSAGQASPPAGTAAPSAPVAAASPRGEEVAYKAALRLALSGKSAQSIGQFQAFLQSYPQGRYAPNATYWIGEGLYAQGRYGEALDQFRKVESGWPRHHKTADALLKVGMSLSRLGDRQGAAQAYGEVLRRFPHSEAAGLVRARGLAR